MRAVWYILDNTKHAQFSSVQSLSSEKESEKQAGSGKQAGNGKQIVCSRQQTPNTYLMSHPGSNFEASWLPFLNFFPLRLKPDWLQFSSVQFSPSVVSDSLRPHESQHARPPCPSPTPGVHSDSRPSSQWCRSAISSSVVPFSSCPQSLLASESFPISQVFAWGGQSTGVWRDNWWKFP